MDIITVKQGKTCNVALFTACSPGKLTVIEHQNAYLT